MIWISIFNAPTLLYIIGEKFWNIFYWGSFFPRRGSQWSIFPGNSIFASPLTNTFNIHFNSCAVSYIKYDCWKRGGFICSSDFEMRVYLLWGKFETVGVLFATRKLSRLLSLRAMWANYCSFEKLYCIKIWQPIQTNVTNKLLYFVQWVHNGYT